MSDNSARHLTWENFCSTLLAPRLRAKHRLGGQPGVILFVESDAREIGLLLPAAPGEIPPLFRAQAIQLDIIQEQGDRFFRLSIRDHELFQPFFFFLLLIADLVQVSGMAAGAAIVEAAKRWDAIRRGTSLLSSEEQIGLIGELWTLLRLGHTKQASAIDCWVGPIGENHDYRFDDVELEVKTTVRTSRDHVIHGMHQLQASPTHRLFVLSLQFQPAGTQAGFSLVTLIDECRALFRCEQIIGQRFEQALSNIGYLDSDKEFYGAMWNLRTPPSLIPAEKCPRLTADVIETLLGDYFPRLEELVYRINVGGLGFPDGSTEFNSILPKS